MINEFLRCLILRGAKAFEEDFSSEAIADLRAQSELLKLQIKTTETLSARYTKNFDVSRSLSSYVFAMTLGSNRTLVWIYISYCLFRCVIAPLPPQYVSKFDEKAIPISRVGSSLALFFISVVHWARDCFYLSKVSNSKSPLMGNYWYWDQLERSAVISYEYSEFNAVKYLEKIFGRADQILTSAAEGTSGKFIAGDFSNIISSNERQSLRLRLAQCFNMFFLGDLSRLCSKEILFSQWLISNRIKTVPKLVVYNNSSRLYRPLWTIILKEEYGVDTVFYFYSVNNCNDRRMSSLFSNSSSSADSIATWGWQLFPWDVVIAWDLKHKLFIDNTIKNQVCGLKDPRFEIGGPAFRGDSLRNLSRFPTTNCSSKICVFDITPMASAAYRMALPIYYRKITEVDYWLSFLEDVFDFLTHEKCNIFYKNKRGGASHEHFDYLIAKYKVSVVDHEFAVERLIKNSDGVVSQPFTSPSVIADLMGKPAVFYDPSRTLSENAPGAFGIRVLRGKSELFNCRFWD